MEPTVSSLAILIFALTWSWSHQQVSFPSGAGITKCTTNLDIIVALDGSNSMYEQNFNIEKAAIANFIQSLKVTPQDIHVGLVLFSGDEESHPLSGNKPQVLSNLNAFQYPDDTTRTDLAINRAQQLFQGHNDRGVNKILIIVTDGRATYPQLAHEAAQKLKASGVWIFALGVTDAINKPELEALATGPQQVLYSHNFQSLKNDLMRLARQVCETATAPPPVPTVPIPRDCTTHLDLIFAIDGSNSMYENNFKTEKSAIGNLIQRLKVTPKDIHVGLVLFSSDVNSHELSGNVNQVISNLNAFRYPDDDTRTDLAIQRAQDLFQRHGDRGVTKVLIIVTDGRATYPQLAHQAAQKLKASGVWIFALGVTDAINKPELEALATSPNEVLYSHDFQSLNNNLMRLAKVVCDTATKPPPTVPTTVCNDQLDLVIAIDGSNSMYEDTFNVEKSSIANMLDRMQIGPNDIRVGLVLFSGDVAQKSLSGNKAQIKNDIFGFPFPDDATRMDLAIQAASNIFRHARGGKVPKILIIITDGRATYPEKAFEAAQKAKASGIIIYVVGVTDAVNEVDLPHIASSLQHIILSNSFETLQKDLVKAIQRVCYRS